MVALALNGVSIVAVSGTTALAGAAFCWLAVVLVLAYTARKRCLAR